MTCPMGFLEGNGASSYAVPFFMLIVRKSILSSELRLDKNPRRVLVTPSESSTGGTDTMKGSQNGKAKGYPAESPTGWTARNGFVGNKQLTTGEGPTSGTGP